MDAIPRKNWMTDAERVLNLLIHDLRTPPAWRMATFV